MTVDAYYLNKFLSQLSIINYQLPIINQYGRG